MIVLGCKNICKSYGIDIILNNITFNLNRGDRVGIVGTNGAGKSTLLNILAGEYAYDSGELFVPKDVHVEMLKQSAEYDDEMTVWEVALENISHILDIERKIDENNAKLENICEKCAQQDVGKILEENESLMEKFTQMRGFSARNEAKAILRAMGFGEDILNKKTKVLSGGERTRLALGCILMKKPDVLLLDEPTNHLDIEAIQWLEEYLKAYQGSFMVVSHDRYFLNKVVTKTMEIENKKIEIYNGSYEFYAEEKKKRLAIKLKNYEMHKRETLRQEEMIRRFKQRGTEKLARRAASREKKLEKIHDVEKVTPEKKRMALKLKQNFKSGKDVVEAKELCKSFGYGKSRVDLFQNVDLDVRRGEKICIVGANGIGKSTFLKILKGDRQQSSGYFKLGHNVEVGYYDQTQEDLNEDRTVLEEIHDTYRLYSSGEIRGFLGMFMFKDDVINLPVRALSGGEKSRLSLLKLMLQGANLLLLDEPTNHLDIPSKEVFEDAILNFTGTAIIVSHDRYLLSKIPDKIVELTNNGCRIYLGKYDFYMEKKAAEEQRYVTDANLKNRVPTDVDSGGVFCGDERDGLNGGNRRSGEILPKEQEDAANRRELSSKEERILKKEEEAKQKKVKRLKNALEEEITNLEGELAKMSQKFSDENISKDRKKLEELSKKYSEIEQTLEDRYAEWMKLYE